MGREKNKKERRIRKIGENNRDEGLQESENAAGDTQNL